MIKIEQMKSPKGLPVPNQFIIWEDDEQTFQSYDSIIATKYVNGSIELDETYWNYSKTTSKYLAIFLGVDNKTIKQRVKEGVYSLSDLNC